MKSIYPIKDCLQPQQKLEHLIGIQGWVKTRRDSKAGFSFIQINDGSCFQSLQLVVPNTLENYSEILRLNSGCSIQAFGKLIPSQGKEQHYEMQVEVLEIIGWVDKPESYPIQPKKHSMEFLREVAHLRPRTNTFSAITRIRQVVSFAIHQYFNDHGFYWINTPLITSSDCEGAGQLFRVSTLNANQPPKNDQGNVDFRQDFFGKETFLTVSGQLNVEAYCLAMSKVYTFGPTFRAENSHTSRHLAEFWMIEPELAFANLDDISQLAQDLLKFVCLEVLNKCSPDLDFLKQYVDSECINRVSLMANAEFVSLDYSEAIELLQTAKQNFQFPVSFGLDLQSEHERYLTDIHFKKPVIVKNYPAAIKSFYMKLNDDEVTVAAMDVLAPGIGEIIGGSAREDCLDKLDARMDAAGIEKEHYSWYRDLRRYGSVPHAGFGLGLERLLAYLTGVGNVRDLIPFPRTPGSIDF